jgi:plastocyanin
MSRHFRQRKRIAAALLGALAFLLRAPAVGAADGTATQTVLIEAVTYKPGSLTVKRGDRIKWINKDPFPHTVTAPGSFDSHSIAAGGTWTYVARRTGTFVYGCTLHVNMSGSLQVQ